MSDRAQQIDSFLDSLWLESGLAKNTLSSYRSDLKRFSDFLDEGLDFASVTEVHIQKFLAFCMASGSKGSTSARLLSTLRR